MGCGMVAARFHQGGTVIEFQCLNCGQKLAVGEGRVGAAISCTNCTERIVVPPYSITQFVLAESAKLHSTPVAGGLELIRPAPERIESVPAIVPSALVPQLARMMMNRLVQALFAQRENLIDTQAEATRRMAELEERIARAQVSVQGRFAAYDNRIAELERQLAAAEEEKRELMRQNFQLAKNALEAENAAQPGRANLREAGLLLRA
jgi:DNA-directed RNA polymerase subunit RPC12/RpoP